MSQSDIPLEPTIILPPGSFYEFDILHPLVSDRWSARIDSPSNEQTKIIVKWVSLVKPSARVGIFIITNQITPLDGVSGWVSGIDNLLGSTVHVFAL